MIRRLALVLAITATGTAACMSVLASWHRGGSVPERLVWVATGLVLVTSAHLLPALLRRTSLLVRVTGSVLWGACLATACIGHAVFFVTAQQHAGELRASAVHAASGPTSGRSLTTVMAERATATAQLPAANARYCTGNCVTLDARRVTLGARVDALNAEADDIRRQQIANDRVPTRRDSLRADPVASRLAALLDVPVARIDLLFGSLFAAVLEGVACLLWQVALGASLLPVVMEAAMPVVATVTDSAGAKQSMPNAVADATHASHSVVAPIRTSHADGAVSRESSISSLAPQDHQQSSPSASDPIDHHLTQLARDITDGLLRPTVADIRRHLGCSQAKAVTLRRALVELIA
ncbi:hypothetical protein [Caballeronia zhejiangensis]|uniref:Uncharacterized protein n=1 Tax=Caballeronia zhejiangensis TaxID=871203 RepID=A0A656QH88_9BURK|nr:hypothetical protein [Caballeronia zhejiangensis]EKS69113.1 hypothetical protein BURK_028845 [Burkholderia sp. SJ98]KDR29295.1 hypothetical protein BG60_08210 [Caballeronia zhejiangensis]